MSHGKYSKSQTPTHSGYQPKAKTPTPQPMYPINQSGPSYPTSPTSYSTSSTSSTPLVGGGNDIQQKLQRIQQEKEKMAQQEQELQRQWAEQQEQERQEQERQRKLLEQQTTFELPILRHQAIAVRSLTKQDFKLSRFYFDPKTFVLTITGEKDPAENAMEIVQGRLEELKTQTVLTKFDLEFKSPLIAKLGMQKDISFSIDEKKGSKFLEVTIGYMDADISNTVRMLENPETKTVVHKLSTEEEKTYVHGLRQNKNKWSDFAKVAKCCAVFPGIDYLEIIGIDPPSAEQGLNDIKAHLQHKIHNKGQIVTEKPKPRSQPPVVPEEKKKVVNAEARANTPNAHRPPQPKSTDSFRIPTNYIGFFGIPAMTSKLLPSIEGRRQVRIERVYENKLGIQGAPANVAMAITDLEEIGRMLLFKAVPFPEHFLLRKIFRKDLVELSLAHSSDFVFWNLPGPRKEDLSVDNLMLSFVTTSSNEGKVWGQIQAIQATFNNLIKVPCDLGVPNSVLFRQGGFNFGEFYSKFAVELDAPKNSREIFLTGRPDDVTSARWHIEDFVSQSQSRNRKVLRKELILGSPSEVNLFELYLRELSFSLPPTATLRNFEGKLILEALEGESQRLEGALMQHYSQFMPTLIRKKIKLSTLVMDFLRGNEQFFQSYSKIAIDLPEDGSAFLTLIGRQGDIQQAEGSIRAALEKVWVTYSGSLSQQFTLSQQATLGEELGRTLGVEVFWETKRFVIKGRPDSVEKAKVKIQEAQTSSMNLLTNDFSYLLDLMGSSGKGYK